jgi:hypothetical protein
VALLAWRAPKPREALRKAKREAYVIIDGALIPIDRIAAGSTVLLQEA